MKKRGLGRSNLDILLSRSKPAAVQPNNKVSANESALQHLAIGLIEKGRYQPRKQFSPESIQELADSIKVQGIIQPIVVRLNNNNKYEIIAGERRWRAAQAAGLTEVPVVIKEVPDEAALAMALIENIQREDLNPLEEAVALQRLIDEFGLTHQQVAHSVGKSRTTVTNLMRLLSLQQDVKNLLEQNKLEMGHARALLTLDGTAQSELAQRIVTHGLTVRETEHLVQQSQGVKAKPNGAKKRIDPEVQKMQEKISAQLGAFVVLQQNKKGKGKMIVHYQNLIELEQVISRIQI